MLEFALRHSFIHGKFVDDLKKTTKSCSLAMSEILDLKLLAKLIQRPKQIYFVMRRNFLILCSPLIVASYKDGLIQLWCVHAKHVRNGVETLCVPTFEQNQEILQSTLTTFAHTLVNP